MAVSALSVAMASPAEDTVGPAVTEAGGIPRQDQVVVLCRGGVGLHSRRSASVGVPFRVASLDGTVWRSHACHQLRMS